MIHGRKFARGGTVASIPKVPEVSNFKDARFWSPRPMTMTQNGVTGRCLQSVDL